MRQLTPKQEKRLEKLVNKHFVYLFMKGCREIPECGFSEQIVKILNKTKVKYKTFDVLEDDEVRENLKLFSAWPTYPQLYVNGEMIGGLDVVKELEENGQLMRYLDPPKDVKVYTNLEWMQNPNYDKNPPPQNTTPE